MSDKHPNTERFGGPGASRENAKDGTRSHQSSAETGQEKQGHQRNSHHSAISGGGGEQDDHHTHTTKRS